MRQRRLLLDMAIGYTPQGSAVGTGGDKIDICRYRFDLLDREGRESLAYHWHPTGVSPVTLPHLFLSGRLAPLDVGRGQEPVALGAMHPTTGPITLTDIVRLLITEFNVEPRRPDWAAVPDAHPDPFAADR